MGRRGPPPKPTALKLLEGNPSKRPLRGEPLQPTPGRLACPTWLDREAKAEWRRIVRVMPPGWLTPVDRSVLAMACVWWSEYVAAVRTGESRRMLEASKEYRAFVSKLGLSPSDRVGLHVPVAGPTDEMSELEVFLGESDA